MGTETVVAPVEDSAVEKKCSPVIEKAKSLKIINDEGMEKARDFIKSIKALVREVNGDFDPIVEAAHKTHKEAVARRKKHLDPLQQAERTAKAAMGEYLDLKERQERERAAEQQRLQEAEDKKKLKSLEGKLGRREANGDEEGAEEIKEEMEAVGESTTYIPETTSKPSVKGVSGRKVRIPTVANKQAIIAAVARGDAPDSIIDINMGQLKKYVNLGDNMRVAGVNITTDRGISVRG
ncbi:hypothetical protein KAR91_12590 [Candidatus Pacearchaeota archaeon]|nr:hypothetical protein [Candidatus Pacearchaeota archaeon]